MSKTIDINVGRFKGSVLIADPLTIPQAKLIEAGNRTSPEVEQILSDLKDAKERYGEDSEEVKKLNAKRFSLFTFDDMQLPAVLACVEEWKVSNIPDKVTAENFPASPRGMSHKLIETIFGALLVVYYGEADIPNA